MHCWRSNLSSERLSVGLFLHHLYSSLGFFMSPIVKCNNENGSLRCVRALKRNIICYIILMVWRFFVIVGCCFQNVYFNQKNSECEFKQKYERRSWRRGGINVQIVCVCVINKEMDRKKVKRATLNIHARTKRPKKVNTKISFEWEADGMRNLCKRAGHRFLW